MAKFNLNPSLPSIPFINGISFLEKLLFTKHLSTMVKAGIPITEALDTLVSQTKSKAFAKMLSAVLSDIENGQSLAKSMKKYPRVFDQFYLSLIEVGEESGTLEENLEFLAKQLAKDYSLRKKIQGALIYPALILSATGIMGSFIAVFVLPKLVDFFEAFEADLPLSTQILLFVANLMKNYGILLLGSLIVGFILFLYLIRLPLIKARWHSLILGVPIFGKLIAYGQLARFSRNFGILLKSGVPVTRSLEVTAHTLSNLKFRRDLIQINAKLQKGRAIAQAIETGKYSEYPPIVAKMIGVGEKTGKLDETLLYLGDFYEDEIDNIAKNLTSILEPVLLIGIGLVVGFVALAIISPIYELTGSIRR